MPEKGMVEPKKCLSGRRGPGCPGDGPRTRAELERTVTHPEPAAEGVVEVGPRGVIQRLAEGARRADAEGERLPQVFEAGVRGLGHERRRAHVVETRRAPQLGQLNRRA